MREAIFEHLFMNGTTFKTPSEITPPFFQLLNLQDAEQTIMSSMSRIWFYYLEAEVAKQAYYSLMQYQPLKAAKALA